MPGTASWPIRFHGQRRLRHEQENLRRSSAVRSRQAHVLDFDPLVFAFSANGALYFLRRKLVGVGGSGLGDDEGARRGQEREGRGGGKQKRGGEDNVFHRGLSFHLLSSIWGRYKWSLGNFGSAALGRWRGIIAQEQAGIDRIQAPVPCRL